MRSRVSFRQAFWGYKIADVKQAIADKLQEIEEESRENSVDEELRRLEDALEFLNGKIKIAERCKALAIRTGAYDHSFTNCLIKKAREKEIAISVEADNYVEARKAEEVTVAKKIEELEQSLTMLKRENGRMLSAISFEKMLDSDNLASPADISIDTQDNTAEEVPKVQSIAVNAANLTALIVEDDKIVENLLISLLEREGFACVVARDGRYAMQLINEMASPGVVLLDTMLPYTNGLQLLKHIRGKSEWDRTAVIVLTDNDAERDVIFAMKNGANDCIQKPFNPRELIARVNRFAQVAQMYK